MMKEKGGKTNTAGPKVSVVIPVYNGSDYLAEAIESALRQTYENLEVIVVNDGSTDGGRTREIALSYGDRLRYVEKENGGVSTALNRGILEMTGSYFSWLSHDDVYLPSKIEEQISYLRRIGREDVVLYGDYEEIDEKSSHVRDVRLDHEMLEQKPMYGLLRGCINGCTLLIPRSCFDAVGLFDPCLKATQDYALWLKMIRRFEFKHVPRVFVKYRVHLGQGSHTMSDVVAEEGDALWIDMMEGVPDKEKVLYEGSVCNFYRRTAEHLLSSPYQGALELARSRAQSNLTKPSGFRNVSVIVPFHDRIAWTMEAVESVLSQTYSRFEIILVDDGSTEDTSAMRELADSDPRIVYVRQDKRGAAAARNRGIGMARGEYIAFLDSDDLYLPEKLEIQVGILEEAQEFGMVYSHAFVIDAKGERTASFWGGDLSGKIYPDLLFIDKNRITTPTVIVRAEVFREVGTFDETLTICEDLDLWRRIARKYQVYQIARPLAKIRTHHERPDYKKDVKARKRYYRKAFLEDAGLPRSFRMSLYAELYDTYGRLMAEEKSKFYGSLYKVLYKLYFWKHAYVSRCESGERRTPDRSRFLHCVVLATALAIQGLCGELLSAVKNRVARLSMAVVGLILPRLRKPLSLLLRVYAQGTIRHSFSNKKSLFGSEKRFALISDSLSASSSPWVNTIRRLLGDIDPDRYCLISTAPQSSGGNFEHTLPPRHYSLSSGICLPFSNEVSKPERLSLLCTAFVRGWRIATIVCKEQCSALVAVTGDGADIPAAYLASRLVGIPFTSYFLDDAEYESREPASRAFASSFLHLVSAQASNILVTNEFQREDIQKKYKRDAVVIPGPPCAALAGPRIDRSTQEMRIMYAGPIDQTHAAAFRRLVAAMNRLTVPRLKLCLCTEQSQDLQQWMGIEEDDVERCAAVSPADIAGSLKTADILFLPLSFNPRLRQAARKVAPAYLGDYLASGTPVLAFVPPRSFVHWYLEKWACGLVVTENSSEVLARAIGRLTQDADLRLELSQNAMKRAQKDFDPDLMKANFLRAIGIALPEQAETIAGKENREAGRKSSGLEP